MKNDLILNMKLQSDSVLNANMSGGVIEVDPIFRESPAYTITYNDITYWNNKSNFSGNYNDLRNKPVIPHQVSQLTNDVGYITKTVNNLTNYTLTADLSTVAISGDYDDLLDKPTIPTKTSDLTNDSGFITNTVNDLTNYTLSSALSTVATTGSYNDLSGTPTLANVATSGLYEDLINKPTLSVVASTGDYDDLLDKPTIPTKTSDLTNDSGFVSNTDYSSYSSGGVIKCNSNGFNVNSNGWPYSETFTYAQYGDKTNAHFISKGTLENVITGKELVNKNVNDLTNYTLSSSLSTVATTGNYTDLTNKPNLALVATTGDYNDLTNKPSGLTLDSTVSTTSTNAIENQAITNYVDGLNTYSTSEIKIGYWIDGKPLYRKVVTGTMNANETSKSVAIGISDVDQFVNVSPRVIRAGNYSDNSNIGEYYNGGTDFFNCYMGTPNSKDIMVRGGNDWPKRPYDFVLIIEYTKTTD